MTRRRLLELQSLAKQASRRRESGQFLIEGAVLIEEALQAGLCVLEVWVEPDRASQAELDVVDEAVAAGAEQQWVNPGTLAKLKTSVTPPPVLAVAEIPSPLVGTGADTEPTRTADAASNSEPAAGAASSAASTSGFAITALDMADPANAGALLRCAEGSGASEVVFAGQCVDSWSPKTVRASAGSVFRVRPRREPDAAEHLRAELQAGRQLVAASARQGQLYHEVDFSVPSTILLGSETHGIAEELQEHVTTWANIPLAGQVESLNVAAAAAVLCFEAQRQLQAGRAN